MQIAYSAIYLDDGESFEQMHLDETILKATQTPGEWTLGVDIVGTRGQVQEGVAQAMADRIIAYVTEHHRARLADLLIGITDDDKLRPVRDGFAHKTRDLDRLVRPPFRMLLRPWQTPAAV